MSVFQSALSSARFNRYLMWFSAVVLAAGVGFLLVKLLPGNDKTQVNPDKNFVAQLPAKSQPLTNAKGVQSGYGDDRMATASAFARLLQAHWAFRPPQNRNPLAGFGPLAKSFESAMHSSEHAL